MMTSVSLHFLPIVSEWVAELVKNLPANARDARDLGLIPVLGRSPGEGKGYPFQYSGLESSGPENSMDYMGLQKVGHN